VTAACTVTESVVAPTAKASVPTDLLSLTIVAVVWAKTDVDRMVKRAASRNAAKANPFYADGVALAHWAEESTSCG
jgi:hypothetical protein